MTLPLGALTGYMSPFQLRPEFDRSECNPLDASEFVASGATGHYEYGGKYKAVVTGLAFRFLDAYDATDRTAHMTDCASVRK